MTKIYILRDKFNKPYDSPKPGTLGGHKKQKIYGRLDCKSALGWLAKGHYATYRVFFKDVATAKAAGYRPCARCLPDAYKKWSADQKKS